MESANTIVLDLVISAFTDCLPAWNRRTSRASPEACTEARNGIVKLASVRRSQVVASLTKVFQIALQEVQALSSSSAKVEQYLVDSLDSLHVILLTLRDCMELTAAEIPVPDMSAPPLETAVVESLLELLCQARLLHQAALKQPIERVVYQLSYLNFIEVYSVLNKRLSALATSTEDTPDPTGLFLLAGLKTNQHQLQVVVTDICTMIRNMKKSAQLDLAEPLHLCIKRWIKENTADFAARHANATNLTDAVERLFDIYLGLVDKQQRRIACWPLICSLLLISPKYIIKCGKKSSTDSSLELSLRKFLESLRKAIAGSQSFFDVAVKCGVYLCTYTSYIHQPVNSPVVAAIDLLTPILDELKAKLFSVVSEPLSASDQKAIICLLVACFDLNSASALKLHFEPFLLLSGIPSVYHVIALKALLRISGRSPMSPWGAQITTAYGPLSSTIRKLFYAATDQYAQTASGHAPKARSFFRKLAQVVRTSDIGQLAEMIKLMLQILILAPQLTLSQGNSSDFDVFDSRIYPPPRPNHLLLDIRHFFRSLAAFGCMYSDFTPLALQLFAKFFETSSVEIWPGPDPIVSFWEISEGVLEVCCSQFFEGAGNQSPLIELSSLCNKRRILIFAQRWKYVHLFSTPAHIDLRDRLEAMLLCASVSEDVSSRRSIQDNLFLLARMRNRDEIPDVPVIDSSVDVMLAIAEVDRTAPSPEIRLERICDILRSVMRPLKCFQLAFDYWYKLWSRMADLILNSPAASTESTGTPPLPVGLQAEWMHLTRYLCTTSGLFADHPTAESPSSPTNGAAPSSSSFQSPAPASTAELSSYYKFTVKMLDLLLMESSVAQPIHEQAVITALSRDLRPICLPKMFDMFQSKYNSLLIQDGQPASPSVLKTSFFAKTVMILRQVISQHATRDYGNFLATLSVAAILTSGCEYLNKVTFPAELTVFARAEFCEFVEVVITNRQCLNFTNEMLVRNNILLRIIDWIRVPQGDLQLPTTQYQLYLDAAALKAVAALMLDLPLVARENAEKPEGKSSLFLKYFTFLMHLTTQLGVQEDSPVTQGSTTPKLLSTEEPPEFKHPFSEVMKSPPTEVISLQARKSKSTDESGQTSSFWRVPSVIKSPNSAPVNLEGEVRFPLPADVCNERLHNCREHCCIAMSRLLSANVDIGFQHAIHMAYHKDAAVRRVFTEVLTRALRTGTEFDMLSATTNDERYTKLLSLILEPKLAIVRTLTHCVSSEDLDVLASVLFGIFESHELEGPFYFHAVKWEVSAIKAEEQLFRRPSLATKMEGMFIHKYGLDYLRSILQLTIDTVASMPETIEIDPSRVHDEATLTKNIQLLQSIIAECFDRIVNSVDFFPMELRCLCFGKRVGVGAKFPSFEVAAVGSFIFLRCISPALVTPHLYGLRSDPLSHYAMRTLAYISKVLQAIANGPTAAESQEASMVAFRSFIRDRFSQCEAFLRAISDPDRLVLMHSKAALFSVYEIELPIGVKIVVPKPSASALVTPARSCSTQPVVRVPEIVSPSSSIANNDAASVQSSLASGRASPTPSSSRATESSLMQPDAPSTTSTSSIACVYDLHRLLAQHHDRLYQSFLSHRVRAEEKASPHAQHNDSTPALNGSTQIFDRLMRLLVQLGDPPKAASKALQKLSDTTGESRLSADQANAKLTAFLRHRPLQANLAAVAAKNIFFNAGLAKDASTVFVFRASQFVLSEVDPEILIYHIISTMRSQFSGRVSILFNFTCATRSHDPGPKVFSRLISYLPTQFSNNVAQVIVLNPGSYWRVAVKTYQLHIPPWFARKITATTELSVVRNLLGPLPLLETVDFLEVTQRYESIFVLEHQRQRRLATIRVGPQSLQVVFAERYKAFDIPYHVNDVYSLASVSDIQCQEDRLIVTLHGDVAQDELVFVNPPHSMVETLTTLHKQYQLQGPTSEPAEKQKSFRPENVPGTLLSVALFNLTSEGPMLRLMAYRLLSAIVDSFEAQIDVCVYDVDFASIPRNSANFVVHVSECFAATEARFCLEFLEQAITSLQSASSAQKLVILEYISPWIRDLALFIDRDAIAVTGIIKALLDRTIQEPDLFQAFQTLIWRHLRDDQILEIALDQILVSAVEHAPHSPAANLMSDVVVMLGTENSHVVANLLMRHMFNVFDKTSVNPMPRLEQHPAWRTATAVLQLICALSFNNLLNVEDNLPYVFHIVLMTLRSGSTTLRTMIYGLLINSLQSFTMIHGALDSETLHALQSRIKELNQPRFQALFGLQQSSTRVSKESASNLVRPVGTDRTYVDMESTISILWDIIDLCVVRYPTWEEKWITLTLNTAIKNNDALQPRAFLVLGIVLTGMPPNGTCLFLLTLLNALDKKDCAVVESILTCTARILRHGRCPSDEVLAFFWMSIALLQLNDLALFPATISLLETCLCVLDLRGCFLGKSIRQVALAARQPVAEYFARLDRNSGINFSSSFSFSIASLLMKGLCQPNATIVDRTLRLLGAFIQAEYRAQGIDWSPEAAGYVAASLPFSLELQQQLLPSATPTFLSQASSVPSSQGSRLAVSPVSGFDPSLPRQTSGTLQSCSDLTLTRHSTPLSKLSSIFDVLLLSEPQTQVFFIATMGSYLEYAADMQVKQVALELLIDAVTRCPEAFGVAFRDIVRTFTGLLKTSIDSKTRDLCQALNLAVFSMQPKASAVPLRTLDQAGTTALTRAASFAGRLGEDRPAIAKICKQIANGLVAALTDPTEASSAVPAPLPAASTGPVSESVASHSLAGSRSTTVTQLDGMHTEV